jgi:hypothetical protein
MISLVNGRVEIPVVVNVFCIELLQNISNAQIQSQIDVLIQILMQLIQISTVLLPYFLELLQNITFVYRNSEAIYN